MVSFVDQTGRSLAMARFPPRRIVSVVPSQTEWLHELGLEAEVVGITKFCVHPPAWFQSKPRVGGTKTLNLEKIAALEPDLIVANKEENNRAQIEALAERFPVWISDVRTLSDAWEMMERTGALAGRAERAATLVGEMQARFAALPPPKAKRPSVAYFIWRKPYMVAGSDTFIHNMLDAAGFDNAFAAWPRYPEITPEMLQAARPDVLFLASEPYPFAEKHVAAFREICPDAGVVIVDGELFSWYGSRLRHAPAYFAALQNAFPAKI